MWKQIYERAFTDELKIPLFIMKKRFNMLNIQVEYLYIDDTIVGFCLLYNIIKKIWHIDYIAIDPLYQNKGYGKLLLTNIINKYKYLTLECEEYFVKYYNKFKFNKIFKDYNYHGKKLYLMSNNNINNRDLDLIITKLNNSNFYMLYTINILLLMIYNLLKLFYNTNIIYNIKNNIDCYYYEHIIF